VYSVYSLAVEKRIEGNSFVNNPKLGFSEDFRDKILEKEEISNKEKTINVICAVGVVLFIAIG
jgi:rhodanese-related sulfurtransferase